MNFAIRLATKADFKDIWRLLRDLATHLKMVDQMVQTYEEVQHHGFSQNPCFECFVAVVPDEHKSKEGFTIVGCALYFDVYDTWKGQSVYLDHFYVMPEFRGFGIGKALLSDVAKVAKEKAGAWLQLNVLDWNTPSLDFFAARGAQDITVKEGWHVIHFDGQSLDRLVAKEKHYVQLQVIMLDWNAPSRDFFAARGAQDLTAGAVDPANELAAAIMNFAIRPATKADCKDIWRMIRDLAIHEKMLDQMITTYEGYVGVPCDVFNLERDAFGQNPWCETLVAEVSEENKSKEGFKAVGFALYFYSYSTWKGRTVYLEDLYVMPEFRGFGIGKNLLRTVAKVATEKQCAHLELSVLGQNIHSRSFYAANGAEDITVRDDWHYLRFDTQSLTHFISCRK